MLSSRPASPFSQNNAPPRIIPLPSAVTAHLRSTLTITSLNQAISELVQNSIDASSRQIKIQVNFLRNSCVVDDDGCGISPDDVPLIGKRYVSSKYCPHEGKAPNTFGHLGVTLSSLATSSTLTVLSRASTHRSTSLVRFSYSNIPIPTSAGYYAPDHLRLPHSGTTVRLEALFGNLPVRVKAQQASLDEDREWEKLKRLLVALLLAREGGMPEVGIILRDSRGNRKVVIKPRSRGLDENAEDGEGSVGEGEARRPGEGESELRLLQQVYTPKEIGPKSSWERVRARHGNVTMEGWISTTGSPSRRYQFISINSHPLLPPPESTNVLHATLNHLFSKSTFSTVIDPMERGTKLAQKPRKSVDRYPKCIIRIECVRSRDVASEGVDVSGAVLIGGEGGTDAGSSKGGLEGENLKGCVELLRRLAEQFLKVHGFQKRGGLQDMIRGDADGGSSDSGEEAKDPGDVLDRRTTKESITASKGTPMGQPRRVASGSPRPNSATTRAHKGGVQTRMAQKPVLPLLCTLSGWGNKVKSARRDPLEEDGRQVVGMPKKFATAIASPSPTWTKPVSAASIPDDSDNDDLLVATATERKEENEDYLHWRNPITHHVACVDPRTGNARPRSSVNKEHKIERWVTKPRISLTTNRTTAAVEGTESSKRVRLTTPLLQPTTPSTIDITATATTEAQPIPVNENEPPKRAPFVTSLLEKWKNPVFALQPEPPIPALGPTQAVLALQQRAELHQCHSPHFFAPGGQEGLKDMMLQGLGTERLSKEGMRRGRVIGQVDSKFVLVTMRVVENGADVGEILVVIDQHAADERWRVEKLMEDLCREVVPQEKLGLSKDLSHSGEETEGSGTSVAQTVATKAEHGGGGASEENEALSKIATAAVPFNKQHKYPITPREHEMLSQRRYKEEFAAWGILYDLTSGTGTTAEPTLTLVTLPRVVLDRGLTEPVIPFELVREHLWELSERSAAGWLTGGGGGRGVSLVEGGCGWVERMRFAPKKLVEAVNSRACRSAIMFGDGLGVAECEELVARLVGREGMGMAEGDKSGGGDGCRFPFMCAHGRPSMVPLVKMLGGGSGGSVDGGGGILPLPRGYGFSSLGLGAAIGGSTGSGSTVGDARIGWVGERRFARVGGEAAPGTGKGRVVGFREAYGKWRERERERERDREKEAESEEEEDETLEGNENSEGGEGGRGE